MSHNFHSENKSEYRTYFDVAVFLMQYRVGSFELSDFDFQASSGRYRTAQILLQLVQPPSQHRTLHVQRRIASSRCAES